MAKVTNKMVGVEDVIANLNREVTKIAGDVGKGAAKAALFVLRESKKLTPIRLGNLRNSGYVVIAKGSNPIAGEGGNFSGDDANEMGRQHKSEKSQSEITALSLSGGKLDITAAVGYSAVYALSVHENPNAGASGNTGKSDKSRGNKKVPLATIHSKKGQWKFLEEPLKNQSKILEIIRKEASF